MIARFYSRETRNILVTAGKHKEENGANLVHEDFVKEDYEKRRSDHPRPDLRKNNGKASRSMKK